MKKVIYLLALVLVFSGCAKVGTSTFKYTKPDFKRVTNSTIIDKPFSKVWDKLVEKLSESFFVINNIDKDSRIINVSFSTSQPEEYIDCGNTSRTFERGKQFHSYNYNVAEPSSFKMTGGTPNNTAFEITHVINRKPSLEGRVNIYVAPQDKNSTKVLVNTRYIFNVDARGQTLFISPISKQTTSRQPIPPLSNSLSFTTNQKNSKDWGEVGNHVYVTCQSTGELENQILNFIKK
ncbi:MAG: hypothetical protein K9L87_03265 [Candidatus Omnitrophica bacterium]|nr:hypothetical protein [Candidatus Omnitrophota bacterium]MCF7909786.1 hypothetical protein [Candidatus Omnitrophota bacterium]